MVDLLNNRKRVFWEALFLTVVVFFFGILIGVAYESAQSSRINVDYAVSEVSLMDAFALNSMINLNSADCKVLARANFEFADKIYSEAVLLEKYESSGKVTNEMRLIHRKYDILRTFLWINTIETIEKCGKNYSTVVYLYEYSSRDLTQKAEQTVWSKILGDLKEKEGDKVLLIPIATDSDLTSLDSLISEFNITSYPIVIIDEKYVITGLSSVEDLLKYID